MKAKIKVVIGYGICVAIILWIAISTVEVWVKQKTESPTYTKANCYNIVAPQTETKSVCVTDCVMNKQNDCFEVTVMDDDGNMWAYYDSRPLAKGHLLKATFKADKIVDVKY